MTNTVAPAYLAPDYRYAGDAWAGANALTYIVYATPPTPAVYAADGVTVVTPATPGAPQDLTGCTVAGTLTYQFQLGCAPTVQPAAAVLPIPLGTILGTPTQGVVALSLTATQTVFSRQSYALWGNPGRALLIVQPRILDANGNPVTVGLQQLFVF